MLFFAENITASGWLFARERVSIKCFLFKVIRMTRFLQRYCWAQWLLLLYPNSPGNLEIRDFIVGKLKLPVRYVIKQHHHAGPLLGKQLFSLAQRYRPELCRKELLEKAVIRFGGRQSGQSLFSQFPFSRKSH